jgi:hypothetical protein
MSKKKEPKIVYLAELNVFGYLLTVVGETKEECVKAMRKEYLAGRKARGGYPRNDQGEPRTFPDYAEYAGMYVMEMPFGHVEWL